MAIGHSSTVANRAAVGPNGFGSFYSSNLRCVHTGGNVMPFLFGIGAKFHLREFAGVQHSFPAIAVAEGVSKCLHTLCNVITFVVLILLLF